MRRILKQSWIRKKMFWALWRQSYPRRATGTARWAHPPTGVTWCCQNTRRMWACCQIGGDESKDSSIPGKLLIIVNHIPCEASTTNANLFLKQLWMKYFLLKFQMHLYALWYSCILVHGDASTVCVFSLVTQIKVNTAFMMPLQSFAQIAGYISCWLINQLIDNETENESKGTSNLYHWNVWRSFLNFLFLSLRLQDLQSYLPQLQHYKQTSSSLTDWIEATRRKQVALQATKIENVQALQGLINTQKVICLVMAVIEGFMSMSLKASGTWHLYFVGFSRLWTQKSRRRERQLRVWWKTMRPAWMLSR